jgi:SAM-dependent methyltransferase
MPEQGGELTDIYQWADLYEDIYVGRGKDYRAEAATVISLIRERNPSSASLLDVACGTGTHLGYFRKEFDNIAGVDLNEDMIEVARRNLPGTALGVEDMRAFDLGRRFDAVTCMFSSIGYLNGTDEIRSAIACMARHLEPGGVLVVEPWFFPVSALDQHVTGDLFTVGERTISRVSRAVVADSAHRIEVHYTVAEPASDIRNFTDQHVLALIEREHYEEAFTAAGCTVDYVSGAPGFFAGVRGSGPAA